MDTELQQLSETFSQFFKVEHAIAINIQPTHSPLPDETQFQAAIPEPFLLAGNIGQLNISALRSLQRLGELAEELAHYLQQQAHKLDLLLHYVLRQQDLAEYRYQTLSYGGAGLTFLAREALVPLSVLEVKLFLSDNAGAVFCYGQVLSCDPDANGYLTKVVFMRIRDEDRELLVRASLQQQARQLKQKAAER
ncbi:MAG: PilZ domain-containing protein [Alishewanella aestuarii]